MADAYTPPFGTLRERVRFERQEPAAADGFGNHTSGGWTPILTQVAARIMPVRGVETIINSGLQATATTTIWVRGSAAAVGVVQSDRIVNERTGTTYNIRYIDNPDERGRFLRFIAETGVAT